MTTPDDAPQAGRAAWRVIAPLVLVSALLALLGVMSADLLSAARAYVGGESLWSKARGQASRHLREYLMEGDPASLRAFERALAVPQGDRRARLELDRRDPDLALVREGFVAGGNHPDDIAAMVRLYRWFGGLPSIARAIAVWAAADADIAQMAALAQDAEKAGGPPRAEHRAAMLAALDALDARLAAHELEFSRRLGEASRQSTGVVVLATLALALALSAMAGLFAWRTLRRIEASERAQRESNARWELAAEAARIGLFEWNLPSGRLAVDARCLALHGLPADAPRVQRIRALFRCIHPDDRARVLAANRVGLAGHSLWRLRFRVWRGDDGGGWRHLELNARRSSDAPIVIGLVRDVSDDELAAQLRRDKEAAEQASAAKTAFLSRASHELRTPLNAVLGFAQVMELDPDEPLGPAQQRRLAFVRQGGEHLLKLVNDILDLASTEEGGVGVVLGPVDLGAALRSVAGLLEPLARARGVALHLQAAPIEVQADRTRLEQVLVNLVSNAIKYNRPGGNVWLAAEPIDGDWAVASVRDDGIGMTDEQLRGLFQPFNRLGAERSAVEGAGLGLVVSRSLVERFGGTLEVQSRPRSGTTMRVRLPVRRRP